MGEIFHFLEKFEQNAYIILQGESFTSIPAWICLCTSGAAIILSLGLPKLKSIHLVDTLAQVCPHLKPNNKKREILILFKARCSEAELKEIGFFRRKVGVSESINELSDIPEEETPMDLSHLGLG